MFKAALSSLGAQDTDVAVMLRSEYTELVGRLDGSGGRPPEAREAETALRTSARSAARQTLNMLRRYWCNWRYGLPESGSGTEFG